jgi:uncharacterized integral membrane protein
MRFLARLAWIALLLVVLGGGIYLYHYNQERVHVVLPPWLEQAQMPGGVAYTAFFIAGAGLIAAVFAIDHLSKLWTIRKLKKRLAELEPEPPATLDLTRRGDGPQPSLEPMP